MRKILKWFGIVGGLLVGLSILLVVALRWMPVYITPLMVGRTVGQIVTGEKVKCVHTWVPIEQMSKSMPLAVVASEDNLFMQHYGFDFTQIELAIKEAKRGGRHRGASTISQQTAKNVFLWSGHSYIRKGLEAYFTVLIEVFWGKKRIMEVYLNSIEMGDRIYGVDACAEYNFGKTADALTRADCALIAATLPNPRRFSSKEPSAYMRKRQRQIMNNMRYIPSFPKEGEDYDPKTAVGSTYK